MSLPQNADVSIERSIPRNSRIVILRKVKSHPVRFLPAYQGWNPNRIYIYTYISFVLYITGIPDVVRGGRRTEHSRRKRKDFHFLAYPVCQCFSVVRWTWQALRPWSTVPSSTCRSLPLMPPLLVLACGQVDSHCFRLYPALSSSSSD